MNLKSIWLILMGINLALAAYIEIPLSHNDDFEEFYKTRTVYNTNFFLIEKLLEYLEERAKKDQLTEYEAKIIWNLLELYNKLNAEYKVPVTNWLLRQG